MGRTACTEPQCLYSRAIPLLPLWAVRPVQSLSASTEVHFTLNVGRRIYPTAECLEQIVYMVRPEGLQFFCF